MRLKSKRKLSFLIVLLIFASIDARRTSRGNRLSARNDFTHGGTINNWVLMMPVKEDLIDSNSIDSTSSKNSAIYRDNLLNSDLFDSTGRLVNKNANVLAKTRSHKVIADSSGWVTPKEKPYQFYYAYATIEAHVSEAVRLFLLGRGVFRIWLNGKELTEGIGAVTGDEPIYFDASFKQGDNSLLILFLPDGKNSFLLEVFPRKRELVPFKKRLDSISIDVKPYVLGSKVLEGEYNFNIPVPKNSFYTDLILSTDSDTVGAIFRVLDSISPKSKFTFDIPSGYNGVVKLSALTSFSNGRIIKQERFIWIGDLQKDYDSLKKMTNSFKPKLSNFAYDKIPLDDFLIRGIFNWNDKWFNKVDSCKADRDIRELGYIAGNCKIIEMVFNKGRVPKGADFPIFTAGVKDTLINKDHYDHVNWLNYKYPEVYRKSSEKNKSGYELWVSLPSAANRKNKKLDLILYLHDFKTCDKYGISCMRNEGPNIWLKKRAITLSPFSPNGVLWDEKELSAIIKKASSSRRAKRCYVTGEGMGGFETYNQLILNSNNINAGIVLNAFSTDDDLCKLKSKPLWIFHGNSNAIVPVENSLNTVNELKSCGNRSLLYSVFSEDGDKIGHVVYEDSVTYKWLFRQ